MNLQKNSQQDAGKRNSYIIAGKPNYLYLGRIVSEMDMVDGITLKTIRKYSDRAEYVVLKLKCLGLEEIERKIIWEEGVGDYKGKRLEVIIIRMEKIPALKAIRERLQRND